MGLSRRSPACAGRRRMRHTRGYGTGRPAAYFALHRTGFFVPPASPPARWALTPPFHPCSSAISNVKPEAAVGRFILCDTFRRCGLTRSARTCLAARAESCPMVSGLSSPFVWRGVTRAVGIKERSDCPAPKPRAREYSGGGRKQARALPETGALWLGLPGGIYLRETTPFAARSRLPKQNPAALVAGRQLLALAHLRVDAAGNLQMAAAALLPVQRYDHGQAELA